MYILKYQISEKYLQFYSSILGFKILRRNKTAFLSSSSSSSNNKDSSMFLVVLSEIKSEIKDGPLSYTFQHRSRVAGLYHFAILLPERRYLGYFLKHIQKNLNSEYYEGMANHAVSESIYIHDPDFNGIEVYRDVEKSSEWKWKNHTVSIGY